MSENLHYFATYGKDRERGLVADFLIGVVPARREKGEAWRYVGMLCCLTDGKDVVAFVHHTSSKKVEHLQESETNV